MAQQTSIRPNQFWLLLSLIAMLGATACSEKPQNTPGESRASSAGTSALGVEPKPEPRLDLSIDGDALWEADRNRDDIDTSERKDLPDLVGSEQSTRLTLDGRVLTQDEDISQLRDRLDGAEVSIELKTD